MKRTAVLIVLRPQLTIFTDANEMISLFTYDPVLLYAMANGLATSELIEISRLDKTVTNPVLAKNLYEKAKTAAENGSAFAMYLCSRFCKLGWGCNQSVGDAFAWAERAANQGFAPAYFEIGSYYEEGVGAEIDIDRARKYYESATTAGFGAAASHLAMLYQSGCLWQRDMAKALEYVAIANDLKDSAAPFLAAVWYEEGDGVIRNFKEALAWYQRASELGNFIASNRLSRAYKCGELGLAKDSKLAQKYELKSDSQMASRE